MPFGLYKRFFSSPRVKGCEPEITVPIDFHAHILPGADHGSPDLRHSLRQLGCARRAGVKSIVATPHFYPDDGMPIPEFIGMRERRLSELREGAQSEFGDIEITTAAEVQLTFELPAFEELPSLCIGGSDYILIEMPYRSRPDWIFEVIRLIITERKLKPVIAHIERYNKTDFIRLLPFGVVFQINADAWVEHGTRARFGTYIRSGGVPLLGSDVHNKPERSYSNFLRAARLLSDSARERDAIGEKILKR